jgi:hypothetical protein
LQDMVRCAVCDVHVPARTALREDGKSFCSEAHRSQDVSGNGKV